MLGTTSLAALSVALLAPSQPAQANEEVSSSTVILDIRDDNAAIDTVNSFGYDNFNPATPVSNWGLMINGDSSTFRLNTTGNTGTPAHTDLAFGALSKVGRTITSTGTFTIGGSTVTITREYSLTAESGFSVNTIIKNNGAAIGQLRLFDTFDPDIGVPHGAPGVYDTSNDVFNQSGLLIGRASDTSPTGYTVDLGVSDARAVVAAGSPFQINSAASLLSVATSPFDANGAIADEGLHIVFTDGLAAGGSTSFKYFMGYGTTPGDGLSALLATIASPCYVTAGNDGCTINAFTDQSTPIDALAGTDILQLNGPVDFSFDVSKIGTVYTNFEVFQKTGLSTVTLTGTAGFNTLGFDIQEGTLVAGTGQLGNRATLTIGASGKLIVTSPLELGALTGTGIVDLGSILTVGGDNSSADFGGTLTGPGGLRKTGSGTIALTGASNFSGALDIVGGHLIVTDSVLISNASITMGSGTTALLGTGIAGVNGPGMTGSNLGALSFASGSAVYLDDNTALTASSLTMAPGAKLDAFFTTNTAIHAQILVASDANLTGGHFGAYLDPLSFSGTTQTKFLYTDVIKAGTVTGAFTNVNILQAPSNGLFSIEALYKPGGVDIQVSRQSFSAFGNGVGGALENTFNQGTSDPDLQNLFLVIANSSGSVIETIYKTISGPSQAETKNAAENTGISFEDSISNRTNMARSTGCTVAGETWCFRKYAQAASPVISDVQGDPGAFDWLETGLRDVGTTSVWGRVLGGWSQTDGDANAPGSNQYISGLVVGADRVVNRSLLLGLATQMSNTQLDFRSSPNDSSVTSVQIGGYFSYGGADAYLNGNISVSGSAADTKRFFSLGPKSYRIESSSNSWFYASSLEAGKILEVKGFRLEPNAALSATLNQGDTYTETGGGGLDLVIKPADSISLRSSVGVRLSRVVTMNDRKIVPELRVSWRHEWLDRRQEFDAAFAGAPTATFRVVGQDFARDSLGLGTGLTVPLAGILTGYFDAEGSLSRDTSSALVSLGARATW